MGQGRPAAAQVCLVGGSGRSGTTLMREIFARHPQVATFPTETRFLIDPDGLVDFLDAQTAGWSPFTYEVRLRRLKALLEDVGSPEFAHGYSQRRSSALPSPAQNLLSSRAAGRLREVLKRSRLLPRYFNVNLTNTCPDFPRLVEQLIDSLTELSYEGRWTGMQRGEESLMRLGPPDPDGVVPALATFFMAVMNCAARGQNATHVLEDSPYNHLSFDRILRLAPTAKLVVMQRDPRDVVASLSFMPWAPSDALSAARLYVRVAREWDAVRETLPSGSWVEVKLEDLVASPAEVLKRVCSFWGAAWDDRLLDVDLGQAHTGRWRRDIPAAARDEVHALLEPYLDRYGYV